MCCLSGRCFGSARFDKWHLNNSQIHHRYCTSHSIYTPPRHLFMPCAGHTLSKLITMAEQTEKSGEDFFGWVIKVLEIKRIHGFFFFFFELCNVTQRWCLHCYDFLLLSLLIDCLFLIQRISCIKLILAHLKKQKSIITFQWTVNIT